MARKIAGYEKYNILCDYFGADVVNEAIVYALGGEKLDWYCTEIARDFDFDFEIGEVRASKTAKDYAERDRIIFGDKPLEWWGGAERFEHLTLEKAKQLIELGFLNPEGYQNSSPTAGELIAFAEAHPEIDIWFDGYAITPSRSDVRVSLDAIEGSGWLDKDTLREVMKLGEDADVRDYDDYGFYFWWD